METESITLTLNPETVALLRSTGNPSEYLDRIVRDRAESWQESLNQLAGAGWTTAEVRAACDALNGTWLRGFMRGPAAISLELHDAQSLNGTAEHHGADPKRWEERVDQIGSDACLTAALLDVVAEFWSNNAACDRAIRELRRENLTGKLPGLESA